MNHQDKRNEVMLVSNSQMEQANLEQVAQMVLEHALLSFRKNRIMEKIDEALANKDEQLFLNLSAEYRDLLSKLEH